MPSFQQRHYQALARTLQSAITNAQGLGYDPQTLRWFAQHELADLLRGDNPEFKEALFLAACEPGANVAARTPEGTRRK